MASARHVVGVDFGTLSARAVVIRADDGEQLGTAVAAYRHGVITDALPATGAALPPDWALQVPRDYLEALAAVVPAAIADAGISPRAVVGIGTDFTACTVLPTLADGTPLCEVAGLEARPHAYAKLWKHHAAQPQADRLNLVAHERGECWIDRYGGKLSSEWALAKGLQVLEEDPELYRWTAHWIEAADWIVWQLCGVHVRNACTAGFKAARQDGQYPSRAYFSAVQPDFEGFAKKLEGPVGQLGSLAGALTADAAARLGLPAGIAVSVGNVDAHVTVAAAGAVDDGQLVAVMGTSTCHVLTSTKLRAVPGICGVVDGGVLPGRWAYEAGQSGVGDVFGWFTSTAVPPEVHDAARAADCSVHDYLSDLASRQSVGAHGLVALDWHSGNRSVLADHLLSGVLIGTTLQTQPEDVYRALVEATAFGTRLIVEAFEDADVPVHEVIVAGGLPKNTFAMQVYADVLRRPLHLVRSEQAPALGAAIHAAVAAGCHSSIEAAARSMSDVRRDAWLPDHGRADAYDGLFAEYRELHDYFGRGGNEVLHRLRTRRREVLAS